MIRRSLTACLIFLLPATSAFALSEQVLWSFDPHDGGPSFPYYNSLTEDKAGNLYGVTSLGGANGGGAAFKLTRTAGGWTRTTIFSFASDYSNEPVGGLVIDSAGNLYGATHQSDVKHTGYVYKLSPNADGTWSETTLHTFGPCCTAGPDGSDPYAGLTLAKDGSLYGTTLAGGLGNFGTVYKIAYDTGSKTWKETVLHSFTDYESEGGYPEGVLAIDGKGNVFGTASQGGAVSNTCPVGCGTVFRLTPGATGYTYSVLQKFNGTDGEYPRYNAVALDGKGDIFGTTEGGGPYGDGSLWELVYSPATDSYSEQVLHGFGQSQSDGINPFGGLNVNSAGTKILGAATNGGLNGYGIVYELTSANNQWTENPLYAFKGGQQASYPSGGVVVDSSSHAIFGLASGGGASNDGVVYSLKP